MDSTTWMAMALGASLLLNGLQYGVWKAQMKGRFSCEDCRRKMREIQSDHT